MLGSTKVISETNGILVSLSLYMPWGGTRNGGSGTTLTDYVFTGQRKNSYIKLDWYGSRWYDEYHHAPSVGTKFWWGIGYMIYNKLTGDKSPWAE